MQWVVQHRWPDGRERSKTFDRRDEARAYKLNLETGVTPLAQVGRKPTLEAYALKWQKRQTHHAERTEVNVESHLRLHILRALGGYRLDALTVDLIREFIQDVDLADSTKRTVLSHLRAVLNAAVDEGLIDRSPAKAVKMPRRTRSVQIPDLAAAKAMRDVFPDRYLLSFDILLTAGLRVSEAAGLTHDRVDRERCALVIDRQLARLRAPRHRGTCR